MYCFLVMWATFGWSQIGSFIIKMVRYVFPGFSAYIVYFGRTKPWPIYPVHCELFTRMPMPKDRA